MKEEKFELDTQAPTLEGLMEEIGREETRNDIEEGQFSLRELAEKLVKIIPLEKKEEYKGSAIMYFNNSRSRYTHGDGMMHENPFWTYGSCTCPRCCAEAVLYGCCDTWAEYGVPMSSVFESKIVSEDIIKALRNKFAMYGILDYLQTAPPSGLAEILGEE